MMEITNPFRSLWHAPDPDQQLRILVDLATLGQREMWPYDRLFVELRQITDDPHLMSSFRIYIGDPIDWDSMLYSLRALKARWPDGAREAARVVPPTVQ